MTAVNRYQRERKTKWGLFVRLDRRLKKPLQAAARSSQMSVKDYLERLVSWDLTRKTP